MNGNQVSPNGICPAYGLDALLMVHKCVSLVRSLLAWRPSSPYPVPVTPCYQLRFG